MRHEPNHNANDDRKNVTPPVQEGRAWKAVVGLFIAFAVIMNFVVQNTGSPTGLRALFGWFVAVVAILHVLGLWIPSLGAFLAQARKRYYGK